MAKKSFLKRLRGVAVVLLLLIVAAVVGAQFYLGPVVVKAAEKFGPSILGTPVKVGAAKINLIKGECRLADVVVGPPENFKQDVFTLGDFRVKVDVMSVFSDTVIVKEIVVDAPKAAYELSGLHSNIGAITSKLEKDVVKQQAKDDEKKQSGGKKVIVEKFAFKNGSVKIASATLGGGLPLPLPNIELSDVGKKSGGLTGLELTGQIFASVGSGVLTAVKDVVVGAGGLVVDGAAAVGGAVVDGAKAVGGAVTDGAKAVGGAIGGLFGGSDKKDE